MIFSNDSTIAFVAVFMVVLWKPWRREPHVSSDSNRNADRGRRSSGPGISPPNLPYSHVGHVRPEHSHSTRRATRGGHHPACVRPATAEEYPGGDGARPRGGPSSPPG